MDLIAFLDEFDKDPSIAEHLPAAREEVRRFMLAADELTALRTQVSELRADLEAAVAILEQARDGEDHYRKARIVSALATLNTIRKDG